MITQFRTLSALDFRRLISITPGSCLTSLLILLDVCALLAADIPTMLIVSSALLAYGAVTRLPARTLSDLLLFVTVSTAIIAVGQYALGIPPRAWTGNPNLIAYLSTIGVVVAFDRRAYFWLAVLLSSLVLVNCTGAWLVLLAWLGWRCRSNWGLVMIASSAIGFALLFNADSSYTLRLDIWEQLSAVRPIGAVSVVYPSGLTHTHNLFGQIAVSFGWIPSLTVAAIVGVWLFEMLQLGTARADFVVAFVLVSSFVDYLYWWPGIAALVISIIVWAETQ